MCIMKFAPISSILLLLAALLSGCKNDSRQLQNSPPQEDVITEPPAGSEEKEVPGPRLKTMPEEQKSDRGIQKKKSKSNLDTLRPKTA